MRSCPRWPSLRRSRPATRLATTGSSCTPGKRVRGVARRGEGAAASHRLVCLKKPAIMARPGGGTAASVAGGWHRLRNRVNHSRAATDSVHTPADMTDASPRALVRAESRSSRSPSTRQVVGRLRPATPAATTTSLTCGRSRGVEGARSDSPVAGSGMGRRRSRPTGRVAYLRTPVGDDDAVAQVWLLPLAGGEPFQLTSLEHGVGAVRWSPSGDRLLLVAQAGDQRFVVGEEKKGRTHARPPDHASRLPRRRVRARRPPLASVGRRSAAGLDAEAADERRLRRPPSDLVAGRAAHRVRRRPRARHDDSAAHADLVGRRRDDATARTSS